MDSHAGFSEAAQRLPAPLRRRGSNARSETSVREKSVSETSVCEHPRRSQPLTNAQSLNREAESLNREPEGLNREAESINREP